MIHMTTVGHPGSAPVSEDFQFTWRNPEHERLYWFWDQMHHPHPVTAMTRSIDGRAFSGGIGKAMHALQMPNETMLTETINGYWFHTPGPLVVEPADLEAQLGRMQAELQRRAPTILSDWENVLLPEVMTLNLKLREYPYASKSTREIAGFLDEVREDRERQWELHFLAVMPVMGCAFAFSQAHEGTFGPDGGEHYQMLQGFPNKSVEAGQALYDIAREAPPEVRELLLSTPVERILPELERSGAGKEYAAKLRGYLDEYGWRADNFELANPSWHEEPAPMLHNLRGFLRDDATDPREEQARAAQERDRLVTEMMQRAPDDEAREQLRMLLGAAQQYLPVQENHNFYIDQMNTVLMRLPLLEAGRRLTADGSLGEPNAIFYLSIEDIQQAAAKPDPEWRVIAAQRKLERQRWWSVLPPMFVGTPPPPGTPVDPLLERFFGLGLEPSSEPSVIRGHGASKGTVTGRAKVVKNLGESDKLEPGDIMVCEMTMPSWTPLFSIVGAVVADSGGVLSHCAIVAREYRIPCVVGTVNGTRRIRDGQSLTVDGAKGLVRING
jgi:pyruvate,water dikinase